MTKFTKKAAILAIATTLTTGILPAVSTQAATTISSNYQSNLTQSEIQDRLVEKADQYVVVENNQFVLKLPEKTTFSENEIIVLNSMIQEANRNINASGNTIDPITKEIVEKSDQNQFISTFRMPYSRYYSSRFFWWGIRFYFTSNAAVKQFRDEIRGWQNGYNYLGSLGAIVGQPIVTLITGGAYAYFEMMSNDLNRFNNRHPYNQIFMDVGYTTYYKMYVLY